MTSTAQGPRATASYSAACPAANAARPKIRGGPTGSMTDTRPSAPVKRVSISPAATA